MSDERKIITYTGFRSKRGGNVVRRNGAPFGSVASRKLRDHSPTGFAWGYSGFGPAQLALGLLLDATDNQVIALSHYQRFKSEIVASWFDRWEITDRDILTWIQDSDEAVD